MPATDGHTPLRCGSPLVDVRLADICIAAIRGCLCAVMGRVLQNQQWAVGTARYRGWGFARFGELLVQGRGTCG